MLLGFDPGKLDVVLKVENPTLSVDAIGDTVKTYNEVGIVRAERLNQGSRGNEGEEGNQQVGVQTEKYRMRDYLSFYGITQDSRFRLGGDILYVKAIEKIGRRNYVVITTETRDND